MKSKFTSWNLSINCCRFYCLTNVFLLKTTRFPTQVKCISVFLDWSLWQFIQVNDHCFFLLISYHQKLASIKHTISYSVIFQYKSHTEFKGQVQCLTVEHSKAARIKPSPSISSLLVSCHKNTNTAIKATCRLKAITIIKCEKRYFKDFITHFCLSLLCALIVVYCSALIDKWMFGPLSSFNGKYHGITLTWTAFMYNC